MCNNRPAFLAGCCLYESSVTAPLYLLLTEHVCRLSNGLLDAWSGGKRGICPLSSKHCERQSGLHIQQGECNSWLILMVPLASCQKQVGQHCKIPPLPCPGEAHSGLLAHPKGQLATTPMHKLQGRCGCTHPARSPTTAGHATVTLQTPQNMLHSLCSPMPPPAKRFYPPACAHVHHHPAHMHALAVVLGQSEKQ